MNIDIINEQVDVLTASDELLTHEIKLGTSVPGIAKITMAYILCFTNEFKKLF